MWHYFNSVEKFVIQPDVLTHFIRDMNVIFGNNFINTRNREKYFTESCSEGPNNDWMNKFKNEIDCMKSVNPLHTGYI